MVVCLTMTLLAPGASALMAGVDHGPVNLSTYTLNFTGMAIPMEYSTTGEAAWQDIGVLNIQTVVTVVNREVTSITHKVDYRSASHIDVTVDGLDDGCLGGWAVPVYMPPTHSCWEGSVTYNNYLELYSSQDDGFSATIHGGECHVQVTLNGAQHGAGNSAYALTTSGVGVCG
jgi:hypothetical protein